MVNIVIFLQSGTIVIPGRSKLRTTTRYLRRTGQKVLTNVEVPRARKSQSQDRLGVDQTQLIERRQTCVRDIGRIYLIISKELSMKYIQHARLMKASWNVRQYTVVFTLHEIKQCSNSSTTGLCIAQLVRALHWNRRAACSIPTEGPQFHFSLHSERTYILIYSA